MHKSSHNHIIEQVPPNYYQEGVKTNFLQRRWHTGKLVAINSYITNYPVSILDVGCASGWFLAQLHKKYPKSKCVGVDIYPDAIKYGKKRYPKLKFKVSDAHILPFKSETYELVVCTEVLEHIEDPMRVLFEIKRVLSKNGRAIIELDSGSLIFSISWFLWRLSRGGVWNHSHLHSFNIKKLTKMLKKAGFKIEKCKKFNLGMGMVFLVSEK